MGILDSLFYDKEKYPDTGLAANALITQSGYKCCLDFFHLGRKVVDSGELLKKDAFLNFKESMSSSFSKMVPFAANPEKVDWIVLFNFLEEMTRPSEDTIDLFSKTSLVISDNDKEFVSDSGEKQDHEATKKKSEQLSMNVGLEMEEPPSTDLEDGEYIVKNGKLYKRVDEDLESDSEDEIEQINEQ